MKLLLPQSSDLHIWIADSAADDFAPVSLEGTLNSTELARANRFRFQKHRDQFVFSQGVLRNILSQYLQMPPRHIRFESNDFGKPFLANPLPSFRRLEFNMSHSETLVLVGVTMERLVGVDTEFVRRIDGIDSVSANYFTASECDLIRSVPANQKDHVFYVCWTRKEAFIKAVGKGLSIPLRSFDTSMAIGAPGRFIETSDDCPHVEKWWLSDLQISREYVAAFAIEGNAPAVKFVRWRYPRSGGSTGGGW